MAMLVPMILLILWIGLFPNHLLRKMDASVTHLLGQIGGGSQAELTLLLRGSRFEVPGSRLENNAHLVFHSESSANHWGPLNSELGTRSLF
jgi:hypothetical protein